MPRPFPPDLHPQTTNYPRNLAPLAPHSTTHHSSTTERPTFRTHPKIRLPLQKRSTRPRNDSLANSRRPRRRRRHPPAVIKCTGWACPSPARSPTLRVSYPARPPALRALLPYALSYPARLLPYAFPYPVHPPTLLESSAYGCEHLPPYPRNASAITTSCSSVSTKSLAVHVESLGKTRQKTLCILLHSASSCAARQLRVFFRCH